MNPVRPEGRHEALCPALLAGHPDPVPQPPPTATAAGTGAQVHQDIDRRAAALEAKLVAWRRDFHEHPELSNREERTSKIVAEHLRSLVST